MTHKFKFIPNHKKKLIKVRERLKAREKVRQEAYAYWFFSPPILN